MEKDTWASLEVKWAASSGAAAPETGWYRSFSGDWKGGQQKKCCGKYLIFFLCYFKLSFTCSVKLSWFSTFSNSFHAFCDLFQPTMIALSLASLWWEDQGSFCAGCQSSDWKNRRPVSWGVSITLKKYSRFKKFIIIYTALCRFPSHN